MSYKEIKNPRPNVPILRLSKASLGDSSQLQRCYYIQRAFAVVI